MNGWKRANRNSLAQFTKRREKVLHVSKPLVTVMVPAGPWPGAKMVPKVMLGKGLTFCDQRNAPRRRSTKAGKKRLKRLRYMVAV